MRRAQIFFLDDYNDDIRESVAHHSFEPENTVIANEVTVTGTKHKKSILIVIDDSEEGLTDWVKLK